MSPAGSNEDVTTPTKGLGWERSDGAPAATGICLSGGGIRAAMFSLGVLQVLQEKRGLLFGKHAAQMVSAVSGGSYIASAYVSNGAALIAERQDPDSTRAPFAKGTPEEQYVLDRGKYLLTPWFARVALLIAGVLAGPLALLALLIWTGFILADLALVVVWASVEMGLPLRIQGWGWWGTVPVAAAATITVGRQLFQPRSLAGVVTSLVALALMIVALPAAVMSLSTLEWTTAAVGWIKLISIASAAVLASAGVAFVASRTKVESPVFGMLERLSVAALMLVVVGAAMMFMVPFVAEILLTPDSYTPSAAAGWWAVAGILAPLPFAWLLRRVALHQFYREGLRSSFGVLRTGGVAQVPEEPRLFSALDMGPAVPRLLISATANGHGGRHAYDGFIFSHDRCGIPNTEMWHATRQLELARTDGYLFASRESVVTLPTSVAATGAALSASMGRYSRPSARMLLALFNIRIGRTIPSVGRDDRRRAVADLQSPGRVRTRTALLPGVDDLVAEMLGVQGPNMYVSDGGHFDNLGLITLLRARCRAIWCVDASSRPQGDCPDLDRAITLAKSLGIEITVKTSDFASTTHGVFAATHATGKVRYQDGETADLHVIKLGLHSSNLAVFDPYRQTDRKFPHHSTFKQLYPTARMVKYRDLGRDNATRCLSDIPSTEPRSPEPSTTERSDSEPGNPEPRNPEPRDPAR